MFICYLLQYIYTYAYACIMLHRICTFSFHFFISASYRFVTKRYLSTSSWNKIQTVQWRTYVRYLVPIAISAALEIASSNMSLLSISVSFHTMIQASKPAFVLLWSIALGLEPLRWKLVGIVTLIATGVMLVSFGEFEENGKVHDTNNNSTGKESSQNGNEADKVTALGFGLVLFSCFCSGARWSLTQLMLHSGDTGIKQENEEGIGEDDVGSSSKKSFTKTEAESTAAIEMINIDMENIQEESFEEIDLTDGTGASASASAATVTDLSRNSNVGKKSIASAARKFSPWGQKSGIRSFFVNKSKKSKRRSFPSSSFSKQSGNGQTNNNSNHNRSSTRKGKKAKSKHALSPMNLLYFVSPISVVSLLPFFFALEFPKFNAYSIEHSNQQGELAGLVIACGFLALGLILVEFVFIQFTSSLSLSICAIFKELILVAAASGIYGDVLSPLNLFGFFICLCGIFLYNLHFYRRFQRERLEEQRKHQQEDLHNHSHEQQQQRNHNHMLNGQDQLNDTSNELSIPPEIDINPFTSQNHMGQTKEISLDSAFDDASSMRIASTITMNDEQISSSKLQQGFEPLEQQ